MAKTKKQRNAEWYARHREESLARSKQYKKKHPGKRRAADWMRKYGLTPEQHKLLLTQQNGLCAGCGGPPTGHYGVLVVDHDHDTQVVRGLLCNDCNVALGRVKDSALRLESLARYVRKFDWLKL